MFFLERYANVWGKDTAKGQKSGNGGNGSHVKAAEIMESMRSGGFRQGRKGK